MFCSSKWLAACLILFANPTLFSVDRPIMIVPHVTGALTVDGDSADWTTVKQAGWGQGPGAPGPAVPRQGLEPAMLSPLALTSVAIIRRRHG